jgi:hypothetical protein
LTLLSAPCLVALFHATSAHGVAPFRALSLPCSRTPSPAPFPSCRSSEPGMPLPRTLLPAETFRTARFRSGPGSAPAFRGLLHTRVRFSPPVV